MSRITAELTEALAIAAGIRHNTDLVTAREEDMRAYEKNPRLRARAFDERQAAQALRDSFIYKARHTDNPKMDAALRVYGITL